MGSLLNLIIFSILAFVVSSPRSAVAQQPYVGLSTTDCTTDHNSTSALGYFCNGLNATCRTFLTFRSTDRHRTVASISALLGSNPSDLSAANSVASNATFPPRKLILVPVSCSCSSGNYQHNASYTITDIDTYYFVANGTFQGLTTCQALQSQPGNPAAKELVVGGRIAVPLRCACPTKRQSDLGFKYLMSYAVAVGDNVFDIASRFGATEQSVLEANNLSETDTIIDFTTLLIPLKNPPTSNQTLEIPVPITPTRDPSPPSSIAKENKQKKKTWIYALVGAIGGVAFLVLLVFVLYCKVLSPKKKKQNRNSKKKLADEKNDRILASETSESKRTTEDQYSRDFLDAMFDIDQTVKVYSFEDLNRATSGFSSTSLIKNSVYRASINGDTAAIKRFDGDISKELNLLQRINHFNVIRLCGVSFNEGHWYLVYEYASNGALSDHLFKLRSLSWTRRIQIALDISTGLNYLHSFSNPSHVHKDIKSSNVLLDSDFRAKIANFGLARSSSKGQDGQFEMTKHVVGTVGYMAPEYLEHGLVSTKLDVYAFGVVLLEIITGKEVSDLYEKNKNLGDVFGGDVGGFVDVSLREKYPAEILGFVVKIIDRCLKKNVEARPSMDEIVQLLSITLSNSLTWESSQT